MLDEYLNSLEEEEKEKTAAQARFGAASVSELAKLAGIKLAEDVCTNCGDTMEKEGSILKCGCGMRKSAAKKGKSTNWGAVAAMPVEITKEAADKVIELVMLHGGDLEKTAAALEEHGMSKEAIGGILSAIGKGAKGVYQAAKGVGKAGPRIGVGQAARTGAQGVGEAAKQWGKGVAQTAQKGYTRAGGGVKGVMRAAGGLARQNPGATLALGAAGGYGASKLGSADPLLAVGDAAGRLLAKTAEGEPTLSSAPIPLDEIRESIQEAQSREDIPGRAKFWGRAGAAGGGLLGGAAGGGAGIGLSHLLGKGKVVAPLAGAALGGLGAGMAGHRLGSGYGAEEARADKAVAMLRAMRAHQAGAMSGFGAGMQRGYSMGRGPMQEKTSSIKRAFSVTEEGHKFDAELARARAAHGAKEWALGQRYGGAGSSKGTGSIWKALRGFVPSSYDPRHEEYVAREHEAGSNAWNPFGGMFTPSSQEEGGTKWRYGKFKQSDEEEAAPAVEKAASSVAKRFGLK